MKILNKDYVICPICQKELQSITNTHLKKHNLTTKTLQEKFPRKQIKLVCDKKANKSADKIRGKTYEEIYGEKKGNLLIEKHRKIATKYNYIKTNCIICQKEFLIKEGSDKKYCSLICSYKGLEKPKIKCICLFCKKKFNSYRKKSFCSKECYLNYPKNNEKIWKAKAYKKYGKICKRCNNINNLLIHHKDGNSLNNHLSNLLVLCRKCHQKYHYEEKKLQKSFIGEAKIERGIILILKGLQNAFNLDINNKNFRLTPKRVARAYYEIFNGINADNELKNIAQTEFPSTYTGMIIQKDIRVFSMCPHHLLPVEYIVDIGYIPKEKTVGISKLIRVIEILSKRPELQEMFTKDIVDVLERELNPKGVIICVKGRHFCMIMRGVKQYDVWTTTSEVRGVFKDDINTRQEFLRLIGK